MVGYRFGGVEGARFCILSSLLDQLNHDKTIDVYHLCKLYHKKRPGIVGSPEDYLYIFLAMSGYIQEQFERETASLSHHLQLRSSSAKKNGTLPRSPSLQARVETTIWNVNNHEELLCGEFTQTGPSDIFIVHSSLVSWNTVSFPTSDNGCFFSMEVISDIFYSYHYGCFNTCDRVIQKGIKDLCSGRIIL